MAIPMHKRKKVAQFDTVRDGKAIKQFCSELGVWQQTYRNIEARIAERGEVGIAPDSTAPKQPNRR